MPDHPSAAATGTGSVIASVYLALWILAFSIYLRIKKYEEKVPMKKSIYFDVEFLPGKKAQGIYVTKE